MTLSKLGAQGHRKSHVWRGLKRKMKPPAFKPEYVNIPLKSGETEAVDGLVGILYPHMMFATLYHRFPDKFRDLFMNGKESNIPDFWEQMSDHPSFKDHPMHVHQLSNFRTHGLPIRVYGDGAPAMGVGKLGAKWLTQLRGVHA